MTGKRLTAPQRALMRKARGIPKPPTVRDPSTEMRELSPEERLQEHLEARRLRKAWDEGRFTASLKGNG